MTTDKLDAFTRAYFECALWAETDDNGTPLDKNYTIADFSEETAAKMITDCEKFQSDNSGAIATRDSEHGGIDFWLTRNRHGAGFWDGDWREPYAKLLTDASHQFGEFNLYIGDDGKIWSA